MNGLLARFWFARNSFGLAAFVVFGAIAAADWLYAGDPFALWAGGGAILLSVALGWANAADRRVRALYRLAHTALALEGTPGRVHEPSGTQYRIYRHQAVIIIARLRREDAEDADMAGVTIFGVGGLTWSVTSGYRTYPPGTTLADIMPPAGTKPPRRRPRRSSITLEEVSVPEIEELATHLAASRPEMA